MSHKAAIIALDFDGVLHSAPGGYTGPIPEGAPVPGALEFVKAEYAKGTELVVFSVRAGRGGLEAVTAIELWLGDNGFPPIPVTGTKPHADLYVDDRGWRFTGDFGELSAFVAANPIPGRWEKEPDKESA